MIWGRIQRKQWCSDMYRMADCTRYICILFEKSQVPAIFPKNVIVFLLFWRLYKLKSKLSHHLAPNEDTVPGESKIFLACSIIIIGWEFGATYSFSLNLSPVVLCSLNLISNNRTLFPGRNKSQASTLRKKKKKRKWECWSSFMIHLSLQ